MEEQLVLLFDALNANRDYQSLLRKTLEDIAYRLKCLSSIRRKVATAPKGNKRVKRRKRRPPLQADVCFKLLSHVKKESKEKATDEPFVIPQKAEQIAKLHQSLGNSWQEIGAKLALSPITSFRTFHASTHSLQFSRKLVWTAQDDEQLAKAVHRFGTNSWQEVANSLEAKSNSQCYHRWMKTLSPAIKRGKWTWEEDFRLALAVKIYSTSNWVSVAEHVKGRTDIQCRERYCNVLNPSLRTQEWERTEDWKLCMLVLTLGKKWSRIAGFLAGRTDNQCWRRFKLLRKHCVLLAVLSVLKVTTLGKMVKNRKARRWCRRLYEVSLSIQRWSTTEKSH